MRSDTITARAGAMIAVALAACACQRMPDENASPNAAARAPRVANRASLSPPTTAPNTSASLSEAQGAIDPTSVEAAGQIVQTYGALIEQKRWREAAALWGNSEGASRFAGELSSYAEAHLEIGNPGEPEGAAGSIYVTTPVIFYGDGEDGQPFRRSADVILRRINDVPGSTEAQRRWHIERIDWAS